MERYLAMETRRTDNASTPESTPEIPRPARLVAYEIVRSHPDPAHIPAESPFDPPSHTPNRHLSPLLEQLSLQKDRFAFASILTPLLVRGPANLLSLREAALEARADLLLVCEFDYASHASPTAWNALNITGFGLFLIPSERLEVTIRISSYLLEPRSGFLIDTAVLERSETTSVATLFVSAAERRLVSTLTRGAYETLQDRILHSK
jgi:hypothetical protein